MWASFVVVQRPQGRAGKARVGRQLYASKPAGGRNLGLSLTRVRFGTEFGITAALPLQRHHGWVGARGERESRGEQFRRSDAHGLGSAIVYRCDRDSMLAERVVAKQQI